jgi:hypothetical protein
MVAGQVALSNGSVLPEPQELNIDKNGLTAQTK